ncbi:2OG-Fe(II) oxygenase [Sphingomonas sp. MS122]|uniref:2OG-Fe(II) oxygenase n=1 Tax=Sphingomonas sp. MS122 TaxID=3412683 RepID=UPI003C2F0220
MTGIQWTTPLLCTIEGLLGPADCDALIARSEALGYDAAPVTTDEGPVMMPELRNNKRVILDDTALADDLWSRVETSVAERLSGSHWHAVGLNERLRFYRYGPGQQFDWHRDGRFARSPVEESRYTFMIYLNEGFAGGETLFRDLPGHDEVRITRAAAWRCCSTIHSAIAAQRWSADANMCCGRT